MKTETPATFVTAPQTGDFTAVVNLLAVLGESERQLGSLKTEIEHGYLQLVGAHRAEYARLQSISSETEAALEVIARRNPQWFDDKKNVTTPFGVVKFTSSSELVVSDENVSIQLIRAFKLEDTLLRSVQVLNREALAELSETELARLAIVRKAKENFKVDTDVIDLGKAVKAADKSAKNAAKTAKKAAEAVAS